MKTAIYQPVVPYYRIALFNELSVLMKGNLQVHASMTMQGNPDTCLKDSAFLFINHEAISVLRNQIFWQKNLDVPKDFCRGDVIVFNGNPRMISNFGLISQAKRKKLALVWWGQGWSATSRPLQAWIRRLMSQRLADVLLLYNEHERRQYIDYGFPEDRIFAANNTVDTNPIRTNCERWTSSMLSDFKEQHGLTEKKLLLFCGRLSLKTKLDMLINVLPRLRLNHPDVLLAIIGEGPELSKLKSQALKLDISDNILWLGQHYDQDYLTPWFLSADCFVYPGAIGLSIVQAFAHGLPVLTHNNPKKQMPEYSYLSEGYNGFTYEYNSADALQNKLVSIFHDQQKLLSMRKNALETVKKYSMSNMVNNFYTAIQKASSISR
ncbi:MAG: hypothetical protein A2Y10_12485 [Planctomycetes bacterium GWF2_41_51]|nr:MAG: hypothetical protein A2Y10_12485 [Planctomycetes bacterium GWF2_41_51]HBG27239.1 hypothetical protein [Phycisphaerales bacterium]